ncbi:hypothetical protein ABPG74_011429 [Tetrahymena malaccensis]
MDQIVQQISIQFPTIPEILALANSTFALLLTLGFFFRIFSQQEILSDFFQIFLQNMYQGIYQEILKKRNLIQSEQCINFQQNTNQAEQNLQEKDVSDKIQLPEFSSKFRDYLEQSSQTQDNPLKQNNQTDEVLESQKDSTSRGFYLSSIEQSNEKINNNSKKPALKLFNKNKIIYSDLKQQQKSNSSKIRLFQNQNLNQNNILESKGINLQRSQSTQNIKQKKIFSKIGDQKYKNYLEKQQNILNSYDLKCKYIEKFMKNSLNAEYDKNDINSRILSSIICENN